MSHRFEVAAGETVTLRTAGKYCEHDIEVADNTDLDPELTEQDTLLAKLAKAVRYKAAGNIDLDPELTEQDALISNILTTLARKLPSKT